MPNPVLRTTYHPANRKEEWMLESFETIIERQGQTWIVLTVVAFLAGLVLGIILT
jgi:hypothetical protein